MSNFLDFVKRYTKILEDPKSKKIFIKRYTQNIRKTKVKEKAFFLVLIVKKKN